MDLVKEKGYKEKGRKKKGRKRRGEGKNKEKGKRKGEDKGGQFLRVKKKITHLYHKCNTGTMTFSTSIFLFSHYFANDLN